MIFLVTGSPGGGKTLNTIKFVCEDEQFKNRPIYYFNINGLEIEEWIEVDKDQVLTWDTLPDNSILIVDEVQRVFPKRNNKDQMPNGVSTLDTHRHRGFDFFFITQHPTLVDHDLRKFVGQHVHYERAHGLARSRRLTWQKAQYNVDDYHIRQEADSENIGFDKNYFNKYISATDHNVKKRLPKKAYLYGAVFVTVIVGFVIFLDDFGINAEKVAAARNAERSGGSSLPMLGSTPRVTTQSYFDRLKPRIESLPASAPVYDQLTEPVSFPRVSACVVIPDQNKCTCYSQQATIIKVPRPMCLDITANGYFDPSIPDIRLADLEKDKNRSVNN
jgi:hypothetical protein